MSKNYSNSSFWYDFDDTADTDIITGEEIKPGKDYEWLQLLELYQTLLEL